MFFVRKLLRTITSVCSASVFSDSSCRSVALWRSPVVVLSKIDHPEQNPCDLLPCLEHGRRMLSKPIVEAQCFQVHGLSRRTSRLMI